MANEITANIRVQLSNGTLIKDFNPGRIQPNQTTKGAFDVVKSVATTETTVALSTITTPRVCVLYNLDATNYVEVGTTTTDYPIRLYPASMPSVLELNTTKTTLYLKANTAACLVQIMVLEL